MTAQGPYYPLPWSVKSKEAVQVYDANGECVLMFYWPAHPVDKEAEAVKAVEDAAREMVRLMNVSPAAYADGHASGVQTERKRILGQIKEAIRLRTIDGLNRDPYKTLEVLRDELERAT